MTMTNDERREVAERLRGVDPHTKLEGVKMAAKWYETLCAAVGGKRDPWMGISALCDRLADLIEPEKRTCHMVCDYLTDTVYCDVCGERFDSIAQYMAVVPDAFNYKAEYKDAKFCPNCGAKVVEVGQ